MISISNHDSHHVPNHFLNPLQLIVLLKTKEVDEITSPKSSSQAETSLTAALLLPMSL